MMRYLLWLYIIYTARNAWACTHIVDLRVAARVMNELRRHFADCQD